MIKNMVTFEVKTLEVREEFDQMFKCLTTDYGVTYVKTLNIWTLLSEKREIVERLLTSHVIQPAV